MKKQLRSILVILLAFLMLLSGCRFISEEVIAPTESPSVTGEASTPSPAPTENPTPEPTRDPDAPGEEDEAFLALDWEYAIYMLESDPSSIAQLVKDPKALGIDMSSLEMTLGRYSLEDAAQWYVDMQDFQKRFAEIDKTELTRQNQIAYATITQTLAAEAVSAAQDYDIYYEPLVPYVGAQSNLPLFFAIYELNNSSDVETYMILLRDVPAYLQSILEWEQERAELGIFMTKNALEGILDDLNETIKAKNSNAIITHFDERIDKISGLSEAQKTEYIEAHTEFMVNDYNAAFVALRNGLKQLSGKCRKALGANESADKTYMRYFEDQTRALSGANLALGEAYSLLTDSLALLSEQYVEVYDGSDLYKFGMESTSGAADILREMTYSFLPELAEHNVQYVNVPEELEEQFSPAAYLVPAVDDWSQNIVLVNKPDEDETLFFTMAHEAYPGHLYQYNYQRALDLPLSQDVFHLSTYAEAWSQYAELLAAKHTDRFPQSAAVCYHLDSTWYVLFAGIISLSVNGYGVDAQGLGEMFTYLDATDCKELYQMAVDMPFYYMPYAFGYANMIQLQKTYEEKAGENYDETTFLTAFLDVGPSYFNIIEPALLATLD